MTNATFSATWLPAAVTRAATPPATAAGGRHSAPEIHGMVSLATPEDLARPGRHAEPDWSRELHDPTRDEVDSFSWLGFAPRS